MWRLVLICGFGLSMGQSSQATQSSCGTDSIPYKIIIDLDGRPEIYCDVPVCFGTREESESEIEDFDVLDSASHRRYRRSSDRSAECSDSYEDKVCEENIEWTSAVMEYTNGTHTILYAQCCKYDGLNYATSMGTIPLLPGSNYTGGTVVENGQPVAFDLVKEVRKQVTSDNEVLYVVTVYRMSCIPDPPEQRNKVTPAAENGVQYFSGKYSEDIQGNTHSRIPVDDDFGYAYSRGYLSDGNRFRQFYRNPIRRQQGAYYNRRRQFYRPIYDEYDYYELEPYPVFRRPMYRRFRSRFGGEPLSYYGKRGRARTFAETSAYGGNSELLEEYTENSNQQQSNSYHDTETKNPLPSIYTDSYSPGPQSPIPLPEASLPPIVQPATSAEAGVATYAQAPSSYPQPLPPAPSYVQPAAPGPIAPPSYATYPQSPASGCAANPCSAAAPASAPSPPSYSYPASQSSYYPGYAGGADLNNIFSSLQCFSADMIVQTPGGSKRMDELEVGDLVLSIDQNLISYSPVVMFLHNKPEEEAIYKQIETVDGQSIKLTDFHLIYITNCKKKETLRLVHAKDVKVGHCIHTVSDKNRSILRSNKVKEVTEKREKGIYAPLTASGDLMVNNVLASCHSNMAVQTLQHTFFSVYRKINAYAHSIKSVFGFASDGSGELPFGVEYMTTVMDILLPKSLFS